MFIGHYGASLVAKRVAPEVPLALLFVAAQAVDIGWAVLIAAGVEQVRIVPGFTAANPPDLHYMPYTHSLPAALAWAVAVAALAAACLPRLRTRRAVLAIGAVVFSHWLLDWVVHAPDLPLWGNTNKVGLGLWNHFAAATVLECVLFVGAAWWLDTAARETTGIGLTLRRRGLWIVVLTMTALFVLSLFGPPPPSTMALWSSALATYGLMAAVAGWWTGGRAAGRLRLEACLRRAARALARRCKSARPAWFRSRNLLTTARVTAGYDMPRGLTMQASQDAGVA